MANWSFADGNTDNNTHVSGLGAISGAVGKQGIYAASTVQNYPLGHRLCFEDGRVFRYGHAVAAITANFLAAQDFSVSGDARIDTAFTADVAAGATTATLTDAAITTADAADVYAGGFLTMADPDGHCYRIKSNGQGSASNTMTIELYDAVVEAINSEADVMVTGHSYKNLTTSKSAVDTVLAGAPLVDVAAGSYAWFQTWGQGAAVADASAGTIAAGTIAQVSDDSDAAGEVQPFGAASTDSETDLTLHLNPIVGYWLVAGADTEPTPIFWQIAP